MRLELMSQRGGVIAESTMLRVNLNVVATRLAPEEPNVYSHGRHSGDPIPKERNVLAITKSCY